MRKFCYEIDRNYEKLYKDRDIPFWNYFFWNRKLLKMSDRFKRWKERIERHELSHTTGKQQKQWDYSCIICHQPSEIMKNHIMICCN